MRTIVINVVTICTLLVLMLAASCRPATNSAETRRNATEASKPMPDSPMTGPVIYLALGDSTGVGVGARNGGYVARIFKRIESERADSKLTNLCVSGATTADVLHYQLGRGVRSNPNLITLGIGINDIGHGIDIERFASNYEEILTTLKRDTQARIVISNIPDISSAPRIPEFARREYQQAIISFNQRLAAIATSHDVIVFDIHTITSEHLPSHPEFFSSDGFHPSDAGYEMWANEMWPVVARSIGLGN